MTRLEIINYWLDKNVVNLYVGKRYRGLTGGYIMTSARYFDEDTILVSTVNPEYYFCHNNGIIDNTCPGFYEYLWMLFGYSHNELMEILNNWYRTKNNDVPG